MNDHVLQNLLHLNLLAVSTKKLRPVSVLSHSKLHLHHLHFALEVQQRVPDRRLLESARVSVALLPPQRPTFRSALLQPHPDPRLRLTVVHPSMLHALQSMLPVVLQSIANDVLQSIHHVDPPLTPRAVPQWTTNVDH